MVNKQHVVRLSPAERGDVEQLIAAGVAPARQLARARVLLKADAGGRGPRWSDARIAEAVEVSARTVARVRADFAAGGLKRALERPPPRGRPARRLDADAETRLIALACAAPPAGYARWSLRLLAKTVVELRLVDGICPETVRTTLKKTSSSPG